MADYSDWAKPLRYRTLDTQNVSFVRDADHPLEAWRGHFERQTTRPSAHQALCLTKPVNAA